MSPTVLITGGNAGIGLATAIELAQRGARVCLACRNQAKAQSARDQILRTVPGTPVEIYQLDLSSLAAVRACAAEFAQRHPTLDALINNAGTVPLQQEITTDGFEMQFAANYLGPFLLTHLLLPQLQAAARARGEARIVHLSSIMHNLGRINPATFRGWPRYKPVAAYAQSKLGNLMFSNALARRLPANLSSQALHPGGVDSEIYRELPKAVYAVMRLFLISPQRAAQMSADLALSPLHKGMSGGYHSVQWPRPVSKLARDHLQVDQLYTASCKLLGIEPLPVLH